MLLLLLLPYRLGLRLEQVRLAERRTDRTRPSQGWRTRPCGRPEQETFPRFLLPRAGGAGRFPGAVLAQRLGGHLPTQEKWLRCCFELAWCQPEGCSSLDYSAIDPAVNLTWWIRARIPSLISSRVGQGMAAAHTPAGTPGTRAMVASRRRGYEVASQKQKNHTLHANASIFSFVPVLCMRGVSRTHVESVTLRLLLTVPIPR